MFKVRADKICMLGGELEGTWAMAGLKGVIKNQEQSVPQELV